jgi:hypothetical protein
MVKRQHVELVNSTVPALFQLERGYPGGARDSIPIPYLSLLTQAFPQLVTHLSGTHTKVGEMPQRDSAMSLRKAFTIVAHN